MKVKLLLIVLTFCSFSLTAQKDPINIVFDVTSSDSTIHQSTMRHLSFEASSNPRSKLEVVIYSSSYSMVLANESTVAKEIAALSENENVTFAICEATMKRKGLTKADLLPNVKVVPDGIMEIAEKQMKGWAYIKEAN